MLLLLDCLTAESTEKIYLLACFPNICGYRLTVKMLKLPFGCASAANEKLHAWPEVAEAFGLRCFAARPEYAELG